MGGDELRDGCKYDMRLGLTIGFANPGLLLI